MSERATDCDLCYAPIPFGTLAWLRHKGRDEDGRPVVAVICNDCHSRQGESASD